jgi:hypothetical protein
MPYVDAKKKTSVSDCTNSVRLHRDFLQPGSQTLAHGKRSLGDLVPLQDR